ncbi:hypothetical protein TSUD_119550 [Trifolium subterraneum]|uniref:F-box domain-containing protein n=1 Tax=Trifolium subterraneum TaxID=3900 RepID=A0A2Z6N0I1_TRISU|nr:hypothetical protein TSUD_119550 [Trifolium subterraneum]
MPWYQKEKQIPQHTSINSSPIIVGISQSEETSPAAVDRISKLPNEILCHILSFLPIKQAFTTTILSKRWYPISYSLTVLRFDDATVADYDSFNRFCRFIDTLILSDQQQHQIKTFSFKCRFEFYEDNRRMNDIKKILKACPNLEDLHTSYPRYIRRCEKDNNEAGEFGSLFLSKLVKADIGSIDVPFNVIYNVEFLRLLKVQEPSLQMDTEIFKDIPVFGNLIHIELWFYGFFHGWDGVVQLLQHCPKLQILYMRKWNASLSKDWDCPISDLECVSSHLKSCTILNFEGSENDLRFAKYILQNARHLEVMTIDVSTSSSDGTRKHQIIEELSTCPRMSSGCKLSFELM